MIGQLVDGHEIVRSLGAGGMGEVYLARAPETGELRALKIVRADRDASAQATGRIRREVLALGRLRHPGIVQIFDAGQLDSGGFYYGMEYVAGHDLQVAVEKGGPFSIADTLAVLARVASALAFAHAQGVIHRDLKPSNVLLQDGAPSGAKIIDFGLAKLAADEGLTRLTEDQQVLGSPLYWAPEQSTTAAVGPPADIYSLGGLAYFALSGMPIFRPRPAVIMVYAHLHEQPETLAARCPDLEIPPRLDELVRACVAKTPGDRPTASELATALAELYATAPLQRRAQRPPELFARATTSGLEQALTAQVRQVVLELAAVTSQPTEQIDKLQGELEAQELDLAMLQSDENVGPRLHEVEATVAQLQRDLEAAFRELTDAVIAVSRIAPADALPLYEELGGLFTRYRAL